MQDFLASLDQNGTFPFRMWEKEKFDEELLSQVPGF
jgi:hypothetical protein